MPMARSLLLQCAVAAACVTHHAAVAKLEGSKPHIVFVLFDDIGFNNVEWNSKVLLVPLSSPPSTPLLPSPLLPQLPFVSPSFLCVRLRAVGIVT